MSQRTYADNTLIYSRIVERYAHFFERPEVRLRFLNNTLAKQTASIERMSRALSRFAFIERSPLYRHLCECWLYRLIFQELKGLMPSNAAERRRLLRQSKVPFTARVFFSFYQLRHIFYGAGLVSAAALSFGIYTLIVSATQHANAYLAQRYESKTYVATAAGDPSAQGAAFAQTGADYLPDYRPEKVWLVEQVGNYERYSNGGRILRDYETTSHPRGYYLFQQRAALPSGGSRHEVAGIVYHTSESHLLPFTSDNNDSIGSYSRGLLEYVRKNKSYNYVIDRYGQIYRIVPDEQAANHAGNSVWADAEGVYVGLNESFIGVSFETNSEAGSLHEQLTEAQIVSGRLLTQILRSRYQIDDANCVTHGLVSVNPSNMRICFHHDWARNFPFTAMGLSDKYKVAPVSVREFGFTYDDEIIGKLGGALWPGALSADEEFRQRAAGAGLEADELRRQGRELYRKQMEIQRRLRSAIPRGVGSLFTEESARSSPQEDHARSSNLE